MNEQNQWYVTIEGNAVGPVSTDLVVRGIKHKKIATNAYVCVVGATEWQLLADVEEFYTAMHEGGLLESGLNGHRHGHTPGHPLQSTASTLSESIPDEDDTDADESEATGSFSSQRSAQLMSAGEGLAPETTEQESSDDNHEALEASPASESDPNAPLPSFADEEPLEQAEAEEAPLAPRNGKHVEVAYAARPMLPSIEIDVTVDDSPASGIDWNHGFSAYFLVDSDVTLPDEQLLLNSLETEPRNTFVHDEAMWNLALCLAFGSDAVGSSAASVFFDVVTSHGLEERIEWMCRTLLSRGFMPSGIPHAAGYSGLAHLQRVCPPGFLPQLESEVAS